MAKEKKEKLYPGGQEEREGLCVPGVEGPLVVLCDSSAVLLPLFLFLIHGNPTGPQRHHQQQAPDDRGGLEEVVLEEVVHRLVGGDGPESVEVHIDGKKPHDEGQGS